MIVNIFCLYTKCFINFFRSLNVLDKQTKFFSSIFQVSGFFWIGLTYRHSKLEYFKGIYFMPRPMFFCDNLKQHVFKVKCIY